MNYVLLSLGTNVGDRQANLELAYEYLITSEVIMDGVMSSLYETEPVGITEQEWFLNCVVAGYTELEPLMLLQLCKNIEYGVGREKRARWHSRELDIDILLYGDKVIKSDKLCIPHERMERRRFVLVPACEIAGDAFHPVLNLTLKQVLEECQDSSEVKLFA